MSETPPDDLTTVFVSYARDDRKKAMPVIELLEAAGFSVWWDGKLQVGERYVETTEHALETARAVVVLWSKTSVDSDWVRDEAMSGRERKCMVPISLDGTMPPLGFRQIQIVDLSGWNRRADAPAAQEVLKIVSGMHGQSAPTNVPNPPRLPPPSRRNLLAGSVAIAGLAGGVWGLSRLFSSETARPTTGSGILVLPFESLSVEETMDDLAAALDTEVRKTLARNSTLNVVARTSSIAIRNERLSTAEIARQFGVSFVLDGNVSIGTSGLSISTSLAEAASGIVRWSQEYTGQPAEILKFQTEIANAVTARVTNEISRGDARKQFGDATNAVAYQEFLKGRKVYRDADGEADLLRAIGHFDTAISMDPGFAAAHAIKARLYIYKATLSASVERADEQRLLAAASAQDAIDLAPDSDDAHSTLGEVNFFARLDVAAAKPPYEMSRKLGFGSSVILTRYATFAACNGADQDAMQAIQRAAELDPLNPTVFGRKGFIHYLAARYRDAEQAFERALSLRQTSFHRPSEIGLARLYAGDPEGALASCQSEENSMERYPCEAIALRALGRELDADTAQTALIETYGDAGLYQQAQIRAQAGDLDTCQEILDRAYVLKDTGLTMVKMDPAMAPMRDRPAFKALLARIGFDD